MLRGEAPELQLNQPGAGIVRTQQPVATPASAESSLGETRAKIHFDAAQSVTPSLCVVIDGSSDLANAMWNMDWAPLVNGLPHRPMQAIQTGLPLKSFTGVPSPDLGLWLHDLTYEGGQNPAPALEKAWEWAAGQPNGAILWVHGSLPLDLSSPEKLLQWMRRQPLSANGAPIRLYTLGLNHAANLFLDKLESAPMVRALPVFPSPQETMTHAIQQITGSLPALRYELLPNGPADGSASADKGHVARLAVAGHVRLAAWQGTPQEKADATALAMATRLVTPLSGAVVLENASQYKAHDLNPSANLGAVPAVPEPEEWALIAVVLAVALAAWWRRRARTEPESVGT